MAYILPLDCEFLGDRNKVIFSSISKCLDWGSALLCIESMSDQWINRQLQTRRQWAWWALGAWQRCSSIGPLGRRCAVWSCSPPLTGHPRALWSPTCLQLESRLWTCERQSVTWGTDVPKLVTNGTVFLKILISEEQFYSLNHTEDHAEDQL